MKITANNPITNSLSNREREVLNLILKGHTKQEISDKLCLSFYTIDSHFRHIYLKFDVNSKTELILKVAEWENLQPAAKK